MADTNTEMPNGDIVTRRNHLTLLTPVTCVTTSTKLYSTHHTNREMKKSACHMWRVYWKLWNSIPSFQCHQCFILLVLRITSFLHKGFGDQMVNLIKTELVSYQCSTSRTLLSSSQCVHSTNRHFNTILFCTFVQFHNKRTHGMHSICAQYSIHSNMNQPKKRIIILCIHNSFPR